MLIAKISDLHLLHWMQTAAGEMLLNHLKRSFEENKPDLIIDAGDLEMNDLWQEIFPAYKRINIPGNHEYYHKTWPGPEVGCRYDEVDGIKIVSVTLWTNLNNDNPVAHYIVDKSMMDFHIIKGFNTYVAYQAHLFQLDFVQNHIANGVDIVVTHHAPSFKSVTPQYEGNPINDGFLSALDDVVENSGAKYWFHGHVHSDHDYMIGKTRVICHPCGYPFERNTPYEPFYVEI